MDIMKRSLNSLKLMSFNIFVNFIEIFILCSYVTLIENTNNWFNEKSVCSQSSQYSVQIPRIIVIKEFICGVVAIVCLMNARVNSEVSLYGKTKTIRLVNEYYFIH